MYIDPSGHSRHIAQVYKADATAAMESYLLQDIIKNSAEQRLPIMVKEKLNVTTLY